MGFHPVIAPLLRVNQHRIAPPPRVDAVLITSGNAIPELTGYHSTTLLAVGDATAERARAAGFTCVVSASGNAGDLTHLVQERIGAGASLLLATGAGQGAALAFNLRQAGYTVHRRVAYAAWPVRRIPEAALAALRSNQLYAALFLSAETARTFVRLLPPPLHAQLAEVEALAIGQPAADVLTPLPWRRVRVPLLPTLDQVLALL